MTTKEEILEELEALGTEQTRKTYRRHGIMDEMFGVKYGDLNKVRKKVKNNQTLTRELWATGNHDARIFATMISEPDKIQEDEIKQWAKDINNATLADALAGMFSPSSFSRQLAEEWIQLQDQEWECSMGWNVMGWLAVNDQSLPDAYFENLLQWIERDIHTSKNRVRYNMNNAVINIGLRNPALYEKAIATAQKVGKVEVDHLDTSCKTPDAITYIDKVLQYRASKKK